MLKTVLIIGATRGLGLGLVLEYLDRGWRVVATTRGRGDDALQALAKTHADRLHIAHLDVTDIEQIAALRAALPPEPLDVLFVSAGVMNERSDRAAETTPDEFSRVMITNALAPMKLIEAFGAGVSPDGAIVAMTSVLGSVACNTSGGTEVYRASKAALNTLLRSYAADHKARALVAMHPGWVRTDMGGANADLSVEESAKGMVDVVEAHLGRAGCVFVDYQGHTIAW